MKLITILAIILITSSVSYGSDIAEVVEEYLTVVKNQRDDKIYTKFESPYADSVFDATYEKAIGVVHMSESGVANLWEQIIDVNVPNNYLENSTFVPSEDNADLDNFLLYKRAIHTLGLAGVEVFDYLPSGENLSPAHACMLANAFPIDKARSNLANDYLLQYLEIIVTSDYASYEERNFALDSIEPILGTINFDLPGAQKKVLDAVRGLVEKHPLHAFAEGVLLIQLSAVIHDFELGNLIVDRLKYRRFDPTMTASIIKMARPSFTNGQLAHIIGHLELHSSLLLNELQQFYDVNESGQLIIK